MISRESDKSNSGVESSKEASTLFSPDGGYGTTIQRDDIEVEECE